MDPTTANVIYIVLWIVLPLLPSFLLFKFLPGNKAAASGPFKGLTVNLGGAFAGYFLTVLLLLPVMSKLLKFDPETYEVWTVEGEIKDQNGRTIGNNFNPRLKQYPPIEIRNGQFSVKVIATRVGIDRLEFPDLSVEANAYETFTLPSLSHPKSNRGTLDSFCIRPDFNNHVVKYKPVKLSLDMSSLVNTTVVQPD